MTRLGDKKALSIASRVWTSASRLSGANRILLGPPPPPLEKQAFVARWVGVFLEEAATLFLFLFFLPPTVCLLGVFRGILDEQKGAHKK